MGTASAHDEPFFGDMSWASRPAPPPKFFKIRHRKSILQWYTARCARVAELVDAHGSGPCIARCGDSSSLPGTRYTEASECRQQKGHCQPSGLFSFHTFPKCIFHGRQQHAQTGTATRSWPCAPTIRALVNSPTFSVLLIFSGGNNFTIPSISGASA